MDLVPKRLVLLLLTKIEVLDPEKVGTNPALQCSQERESSKAADPARA